MSRARLVITAIEVEGRTPAEVIAAYGVSRFWLYELLASYRAEGDAAFEPRSRRPTGLRGPPPRRPSSWCCGSANSCPTRAWTPAPRRSAGT
jgi:transposase